MNLCVVSSPVLHGFVCISRLGNKKERRKRSWCCFSECPVWLVRCDLGGAPPRSVPAEIRFLGTVCFLACMNARCGGVRCGRGRAPPRRVPALGCFPCGRVPLLGGPSGRTEEALQGPVSSQVWNGPDARWYRAKWKNIHSKRRTFPFCFYSI